MTGYEAIIGDRKRKQVAALAAEVKNPASLAGRILASLSLDTLTPVADIIAAAGPKAAVWGKLRVMHNAGLVARDDVPTPNGTGRSPSAGSWRRTSPA